MEDRETWAAVGQRYRVAREGVFRSRAAAARSLGMSPTYLKWLEDGGEVRNNQWLPPPHPTRTLVEVAWGLKINPYDVLIPLGREYPEELMQIPGKGVGKVVGDEKSRLDRVERAVDQLEERFTMLEIAVGLEPPTTRPPSAPPEPPADPAVPPNP